MIQFIANTLTQKCQSHLSRAKKVFSSSNFYMVPSAYQRKQVYFHTVNMEGMVELSIHERTNIK